MKKILLLSDTHSHIDERIISYAKQADEIWHAGDIGDLTVTDSLEKINPVRGVYGNIDSAKIRTVFPHYQSFKCEEVSVLMTHIGGTPKRYAKGVKEQLEIHQPKLFVCGHSHILKVQFDSRNQTLYMNPGAAGKSGFHKVRTMLRFVIEGNDIKDLEVIELGDRSPNQLS